MILEGCDSLLPAGSWVLSARQSHTVATFIKKVVPLWQPGEENAFNNFKEWELIFGTVRVFLINLNEKEL